MKIAYITQSYPPMISGAALVVERLAQAMAGRGHETLVLCASDKGRGYTSCEGGARIVRLASLPNPKRAYQGFVPASLYPIQVELNAFGPDIIHIHEQLSMGVAGLLYGRAMGVPVVATVHQLPWFVSAYLPGIPGLKASVEGGLWMYSRWLRKKCERMIVPTATVSMTIADQGGFPTTVISNGVDLDLFGSSAAAPDERDALYRRLGMDPQKPVILHVGRLDQDKGVQAVVRAAARVMGESDAQLLVVGDGECRIDLIALAGALGIGERAFFPGFMHPRKEIPTLYRAATVFCTASEIETQGLVLLEAMAAGLPVVAVDATCIHEVVIDGRNGYLVPSGEEGVMANRLLRLLADPALARQLGAQGRTLVSEQHSIKCSLDSHEDLYRATIHACSQVVEPEGVGRVVKWADFFRNSARNSG